MTPPLPSAHTGPHTLYNGRHCGSPASAPAPEGLKLASASLSDTHTHTPTGLNRFSGKSALCVPMNPGKGHVMCVSVMSVFKKKT